MQRSAHFLSWVFIHWVVTLSCFGALGDGDNEKERVSQIEAGGQETHGPELGLAFDLRPSWESSRGAMHLENEIALELGFSPDFHLGYIQEFQTNLFEPVDSDGAGLNPQAHDGYAKAELNNLWKSGRTSFSYEGRAYLPTHAPERDAGLVTTFRNYAKITYEASENLAFGLWDVPILHLYSRSGAEAEDGPKANPFFENRVYLSTNFTFLEKTLSVNIPFIFQAIRHSAFLDEASHNNAWSYVLWVNPEITYSLSEQNAIGIGYYSENLITDDFSSSDFAGGFKNGVIQFIFQQSI